MSRRFHLSRDPPPQAVLVGIVIALLFLIGERAGPTVSACLIELAGAALGTAAGISAGHPALCAIVGAVLALPIAWFVFVVVEGIGC
jgi:hypothetical protein